MVNVRRFSTLKSNLALTLLSFWRFCVYVSYFKKLKARIAYLCFSFTDVLVSMDPRAQAISMTLASLISFPHLLQINLLFTTTPNGGAARPWDARIHTSPAERYNH